MTHGSHEHNFSIFIRTRDVKTKQGETEWKKQKILQFTFNKQRNFCFQLGNQLCSFRTETNFILLQDKKASSKRINDHTKKEQSTKQQCSFQFRSFERGNCRLYTKIEALTKAPLFSLSVPLYFSRKLMNNLYYKK